MKNILIVLIMVMVTGCNYLEDYSQDLVLASSVSDFDEVLLGDVYIPSKTEVKDLAWGDVGWWLHIMDDDVNGVVAREAENREWNYAMTSSYFGYTAWQMEVGRNYDGDNLAADNALWDDFYKRINICNIILDEIEDIDILKLDPFIKFGKPARIASLFGGRDGYIRAVRELEQEIYKAA